MVHVAHYMVHVAHYMAHVAHYMVHVDHYMVHVAHYMVHVMEITDVTGIPTSDKNQLCSVSMQGAGTSHSHGKRGSRHVSSSCWRHQDMLVDCESI